MKKITFFLSVATLFFAAMSANAADLKIAVVDARAVLEKSPQKSQALAKT